MSESDSQDKMLRRLGMLDWWSRRHTFAIAAIIVAGFLLRLELTHSLPRMVKWDESDYLLLGRSLVTGQGYTRGFEPETHHPPFFPLITGAIYLAVGDLEKSSDIAYALFGGLMLLPIFVLARRIYGYPMAYLAAILLAIYPVFTVVGLYWGTMLEPLYIFLLFGALVTWLIGMEERRPGMMAVAGMMFAMGFLTRPEPVVHFGIFFLVLLFWRFRNPVGKGIKLRLCASFAGAFLLTAAPYLVYMHAQTGHWTLSGKGALTWEQGSFILKDDRVGFDWVYTRLDSSGQQVYAKSPERQEWSLIGTILSDPKAFFARTYESARILGHSALTNSFVIPLLLPFVVISLSHKVWDRRRLGYELFLASAFLIQAAVVLPFANLLLRYLVPVIPVFLIWTANGALAAGVWLRDSAETCWGRALRPALSACLLCLPAAAVVAQIIRVMPGVAESQIAHEKFGDKFAAQWLKKNSSPDAIVLADDSNVTVYGERRRIYSPHCDLTHLMSYARYHKADYLLTSDTMLLKIRRELSIILEKGTPELELVFSYKEPNERTLLYRILPPPDSPTPTVVRL
jgi:4-amino-4-deoxy-L-arabinose transferase-like glycosyltransferase